MRTMLTTVLLAGAIASTALCDDGDFQWQGQLKPNVTYGEIKHNEWFMFYT